VMVLITTLAGAGEAFAQAEEREDPERAARLARSGAGLRIGTWQVRDLRDVDGASASTWPYVEAYWQRGIDMHLAIESTIGLWRRRETHPGTDGLTGTPPSAVNAYVIPLLTAVKFYPATRPGSAVEPYLQAGLGFALGIEDREGSAGGLLGGRGSGTSMVTGFGARGGAGTDVRLGGAFGATVGVTYQWLRYGDPLAGAQTYQGLAFTAGLTYRFRY
jgi:hypothetical protein